MFQSKEVVREQKKHPDFQTFFYPLSRLPHATVFGLSIKKKKKLQINKNVENWSHLCIFSLLLRFMFHYVIETKSLWCSGNYG